MVPRLLFSALSMVWCFGHGGGLTFQQVLGQLRTEFNQGMQTVDGKKGRVFRS